MDCHKWSRTEGGLYGVYISMSIKGMDSYGFIERG
jgi:hypothetical protein